jgi:hypothetical protein
VLLPVLVTALAYVVIGASASGPAGRLGDPSYLIHAGQRYLAPALLPPGAFVDTGAGYDGQFFFYLAQDPLLRGRAARRDQTASAHVDNVAYRYQRILLPVLGWMSSAGGHPRLLVWTLPLVNLLAILGATAVLASWLRRQGRSPWWALGFALSIGLLAGFVRDVSDPLAASLFAVGLVWWLDDRTAAAVAALTLCLLARELYVLPIAVIAGTELVRSGRRAWPWAAPLAVLALWQGVLRLVLAASPTDDANSPSWIPLVGAVRAADDIARHDVLGAANWELAFMALVLALCGLLAVQTARVVRRAWRRRAAPTRVEALTPVALASVGIFAFLTRFLWSDTPSYVRFAAPIAAALVVLEASRPRRWTAGFILGLGALTVTNPVVALLPTAHGPVVRPAAPDPHAARTSAITQCLTKAGLTARRTEDPRPGFTSIAVSLRSGASVTVTIFPTPERAAREAQALRFLTAAGGRAAETAVVRRGDALLSSSRARIGKDGPVLERCL